MSEAEFAGASGRLKSLKSIPVSEVSEEESSVPKSGRSREATSKSSAVPRDSDGDSAFSSDRVSSTGMFARSGISLNSVGISSLRLRLSVVLKSSFGSSKSPSK